MNPIAKRILCRLSLLTVLLSGAACTTMSVENLTPASVPVNPSGIYTLSAKAIPQSEAIDRNSIHASVTIAGETHPMTSTDQRSLVFDYDFRLPEGIDEARYFYTIHYRFFRPGHELGDLRSASSSLQNFRLVSRSAISLDTERAPIGTPIAVLGRGFGRSDRVFVGDTPAETRFVSENTLQFIVPNLTPNRSYPVEVRGGRSTDAAGSLRVDPGSPLRVIPATIKIESGERATIVLSLESSAPASGIPINVETDIPDSIIMPEIRIPGNSRTINVNIEGGDPGNGTLFLSGPGLPEIRVPLTVR